jgi:hypothetical protein
MKNNLLQLLFFGSINIVFAQKITIQFDAAPSTPPSVTKAILKYNKDFAYSFTLDDAAVDAYTCALPVFKGGLVSGNGQTYSGLFYTDGCGNDIPFRGGIAWNTVNLAGFDVHTGNVPGQLSWKQLDTLYDLGWDVMNHSYSHRSKWNGAMSGNDYAYEVEQNRVAVQNKTQKRIEMPIFVVPSGDTFYNNIAYQQGHRLVFNQPGDIVGFGGLDVTADYNFDAKIVHRMLVEESLAITPTFLDRAVAKTTGGTKIWYNEFTHHIDDFSANAPFGFKDFQTHFKRAADTWGKNGTDKMWMAPLQEVYEYLLMRRFANFTTSANGTKVDLTFDLYNIPKWLRRRSLSLVVNSTTNFSNVTVPAGVKVTFKGIGNQKLINLDFTDFKTTSVFEEKIAPSVLRVYPNPTTDFLTIELPNEAEQIGHLTIYDISGRVVLTQNMNQKTIQLNASKWENGQYIIKIQQGKTVYQTSFMK